MRKSLLPVLAALAACPMLLGASWWDTAYSLVRKGNDAYRREDYEKALACYEDTLARKPGSPVPSFNRSATLQKAGESDLAVEEYMKLLGTIPGDKTPENTNLRQAAHYNMGNAFYGKGAWAEALQAYREALRLDPGDADAKRNYELALQQLKNSSGDSSGENKDGEPQDKNEGQEQKNEEQSEDRQEGSSSQNQGAQKQEQKEGREKKEGKEEAGKEFSKEEAERLLQMLAQYQKDAMHRLEEQQHAQAADAGGQDW
jgi:tetratricopeptide (TPR) repeat protein